MSDLATEIERDVSELVASLPRIKTEAWNAIRNNLLAGAARIRELEAQLAERDAEIRRLNMEMSVYRQGYTQKDAEAVLAIIQVLDDLKRMPLPQPPKEPK